MFKQLNDPPLKTVVGLSNIYNGCPEHVKSPLAAAFLALLDPGRSRRGDHGPRRRAADGGRQGRCSTRSQVDESVRRSVEVLNNETLYCNSYLD